METWWKCINHIFMHFSTQCSLNRWWDLMLANNVHSSQSYSSLGYILTLLRSSARFITEWGPLLMVLYNKRGLKIRESFRYLPNDSVNKQRLFRFKGKRLSTCYATINLSVFVVQIHSYDSNRRGSKCGEASFCHCLQ